MVLSHISGKSGKSLRRTAGKCSYKAHQLEAMQHLLLSLLARRTMLHCGQELACIPTLTEKCSFTDLISHGVHFTSSDWQVYIQRNHLLRSGPFSQLHKDHTTEMAF